MGRSPQFSEILFSAWKKFKYRKIKGRYIRFKPIRSGSKTILFKNFDFRIDNIHVDTYGVISIYGNIPDFIEFEELKFNRFRIQTKDASDNINFKHSVLCSFSFNTPDKLDHFNFVDWVMVQAYKKPTSHKLPY